jgi:hypothetical protein
MLVRDHTIQHLKHYLSLVVKLYWLLAFLVRIQCGAPDFVITKQSRTMGCVEAKDVDTSLDEAERYEQLQRYRSSISNQGAKS